uniref:Uncharacterized protein n=1 Tax=Romanomermis culicivorax TaxID=13658 RepID=A0A915JR42_ROMCU
MCTDRIKEFDQQLTTLRQTHEQYQTKSDKLNKNLEYPTDITELDEYCRCLKEMMAKDFPDWTTTGNFTLSGVESRSQNLPGKSVKIFGAMQESTEDPLRIES